MKTIQFRFNGHCKKLKYDNFNCISTIYDNIQHKKKSRNLSLPSKKYKITDFRLKNQFNPKILIFRKPITKVKISQPL